MDIIGQSLDTYFTTANADLLVKAYTEPHRSYHTMTHIWHMLNTVNDMVHFYGLGEREQVLLHKITWWHDVVYAPGQSNNEEESAFLYILSDEGDELVADAIRDTASHKNPSSFLSALAIDADLLGLGGNPHIYEINRRNVKEEFSQYTEEQWVTGRTKFINSMLGDGPIFLTSFGAAYEHQARMNLDNELWVLNEMASAASTEKFLLDGLINED